MVAATATATEMQNNFGKYLGIVMGGGEVVVTRNGRIVGRFIPNGAAVSFLSDQLLGVLGEEYDLDDVKEETLRRRYEIADRR